MTEHIAKFAAARYLKRMDTLFALYEDWLAENRAPPAEILKGLHDGFDAVRMPAEGMDAVRTHGRLAAGGYGEDRAIYDNAAFGAGVSGVEPRTVHLGIDIFAGEGTPVFAPRAGKVHSFRDNAAALDYGPTIIFEHRLTDALTVWSLFGHLSRDSLEDLAEGQVFAAGQRLGRLGTREVNGGWLPHLHFQLILEIGDMRGDFPGVCRRSESAAWLRRCPNPAGWLGIA